MTADTYKNAPAATEAESENILHANYTTNLEPEQATALLSAYPCCFLYNKGETRDDGKTATGKDPKGGAWQKHPRKAETWRPDTGVGVICGEIPEGFPAAGMAVHCLDVDARHKVLADCFREYLAEYLADLPGEKLTRTGKPPKFLVPFVIREPLRKADYTTRKWYPPGIEKSDQYANQLEVLGTANQFVAYAIHPDTGQPYHWEALDGLTLDDQLHAVPPDHLLELTREDLAEIKAAFERMAEDCGLVLEPVGGGRKRNSSESDQPDVRKWNSSETEQPADNKRNSSESCQGGVRKTEQFQNSDKTGGYVLAEVLPYVRNDDEYDTWQKVGGAIKEAGGTYDQWVEWSAQSSKHDETNMPRKWESFGKYARRPAGMGSLVYLAWQGGMPKREKAAIDPGGSTCATGLSDSPAVTGDWPELVSLDTAPPARLPVDQWPEPLRAYALEASRETETPAELPAMLALGVVAAAAQRLADVQVKAGYVEPINIFTAVALPPAARKSAEFKRATKSLVRWEAKQREAHAEAIKHAESLLATHRERVKALRAKAAKAKDDAEAETLAQQVAELEASEPELPTVPRVFTSDVTTEHLASMMASNNETLAVMSPEGGIFETMAGRYSNAVPNIDLYLQAHAGDAVRVDRGSKPPALLDNPRLTMALAVQPDVLEALSNKPGFRGRGLVGRFLFVLPPSQLGERTGNNDRMTPFAEIDLHNRVAELLEAAQAAESAQTLALTQEAGALWNDCWQAVEAQLGEFGRFHHMTDWAGKLPGAVARIAALFHLARLGVPGLRQPIEAQDMAAAVRTGQALASHALAVYGAMGADPDIEGAKVLLRWIKRHALAEFTARDAYKAHKSRFPRAGDVDAPLAVLVERGYIAEIPQETGPGRPSRPYRVNPAVL